MGAAASMWLKAVVLWAVILVLAIANGFLREALLIPTFGRFTGLLASGLALSLLIFLVAALAAPWFNAQRARSYWNIGALWLVLTLAFEFAFGRLVQGKPWHELLQAYTFSGGNIWPLVLVTALLSPRLAASLRRIV